ncbi:transposase [Ktedonobacter sp. SOSP1-52]|uniref:RNA-guided endonuclease InsQ/TnpB family protein n=1 Tax=Ktedonobacter sp. SOSP1-52 TaxID=2778366 RepID=UPI001A316628|nr:transposase [Ktedonobacter sp. SOSP1-52]GHO65093.1 transposase [Ktedonobacter sp. SOSP1-52]
MATTSLNMQKKAAEKKPRKTYLFRIYPSRKQIQKLEAWLGLCCEVYNAALDERKSAYRMAGVSLSYEHQCAELPACKEVCPALNEVPSQVLQDVVKRVDRAFDDFFRRVEQGQKPGHPRFKSRFRYDSLTFKQYGNSFNILPASKKNKATLVLAKLGHVKMVRHRAIKGTPKTAVVKRTPTGKWFVSISVEMQEEEIISKLLPASEEAVGIDVGLKTFAYLSCGEEIANPRFLRAEEAALARAGRKLSKAPKGSKQRAKKRKVVARVHERIGNRRKNFIEQEVCHLIKRFGLLVVEALVVRNMVKNPKLAKSIADASWSMFFTRLQAKAEEAGRQVVRVNPAYTSQTCSACGHRQQMPLSVRVYECPQCGLVIHRDHNGSLNILSDGFQAVGRHSRVIPEAPGL